MMDFFKDGVIKIVQGFLALNGRDLDDVVLAGMKLAAPAPMFGDSY
jgi:hypothetical protein